MGWDIFFPPASLEIRQDSFITGIRGRERNAAKTCSQDEKRARELKRAEAS